MKQFCYYLLGHRFQLLTDHAPLSGSQLRKWKAFFVIGLSQFRSKTSTFHTGKAHSTGMLIPCLVVTHKLVIVQKQWQMQPQKENGCMQSSSKIESQSRFTWPSKIRSLHVHLSGNPAPPLPLCTTSSCGLSSNTWMTLSVESIHYLQAVMSSLCQCSQPECTTLQP